MEDFDDLLEELDPDFRKSLKVAAREFQAGKSITLKKYLKERLARLREREVSPCPAARTIR
jgi:hypothetical protein